MAKGKSEDPGTADGEPDYELPPISSINTKEKKTDKKPQFSADFPLSALDFWKRFVSKEQGWWMHFHSKYGEYDDFTEQEWSLAPDKSCLQREATYTIPMNSKFAPPRCAIFNVCYCRFVDNYDHLILYSSTVSKDVPYGDSFTTEIIYDVKTSEDSPNECHLDVTTWNAWTKRGFLSGIIDSETEKKMKPYFLQWLEEAMDAAEEYAEKRDQRLENQTGKDSKEGDDKKKDNEDGAQKEGKASTADGGGATKSKKPRKKQTFTTAAANEPAAASEASSFLEMSLMQRLVVVFLVLVVITQLMLIWNVQALQGRRSHVELQLVSATDRVEFLSKFVGYLSTEISNQLGKPPAPGIEEEYSAWRSVSFGDQLRAWQNELNKAKASLSSSQALINSLESTLSQEYQEQQRFEAVANEISSQ